VTEKPFIFISTEAQTCFLSSSLLDSLHLLSAQQNRLKCWIHNSSRSKCWARLVQWN